MKQKGGKRRRFDVLSRELREICSAVLLWYEKERGEVEREDVGRGSRGWRKKEA